MTNQESMRVAFSRACLWAALFTGAPVFSRAAVADETEVASFSKTTDGRYRITPHQKIGKSPATASTSSGIGPWVGTAGIALALAAFGGISVAAKRFLPRIDTGPLRVIGRTSLSPRHTVYLLKAGDKVLLIGTGPQGAPSLLGELPSDGVGPSVVREPTVASSVARFRVGSGT